MHLLDLGMAELSGDPIWHHHQRSAGSSANCADEAQEGLFGDKIVIRVSPTNGELHPEILNCRSSSTNIVLEKNYVKFLHRLQLKVKEYCPELCVRSVCKRKDLIFRASTDFQKHTWRDWALIDWDEEGKLPCHILGFVDLSALPNDLDIAQ